MTSPTYPTSLDVAAGQPTSYQQYNRLRSDALLLGASPYDAVTLGKLLSHFISGIQVTYLATNRLRIFYDPRFPPTVMINGYMCQVDHNVDLSSNSFSGGAADWYIFANHTTGSSAFTISVNTSATEGPDQRLIGICHWDGSALDQTSILTYQENTPGGKTAIITLHANITYSSQTSYTTGQCCHQCLDFSKLKPGAKSAYLMTNLFAASASAYARLYNTTDSVTIVEVSTTATAVTNMVKSGELLPSLPSGETELRFEIKTSGSRVDCYWAALIFEY
jgi:hypothetical protein